MSKTAKILLLTLAAFFFLIGLKSAVDAPSYEELTSLKAINGVVQKLHCPRKGAAALSIEGSELTYNLTVKFKNDYCNNDDSQRLLGNDVEIKALQVNENYMQIYQLTDQGEMIVSPQDIEADRSNATIGLFLIAILLSALVFYKSRKKVLPKNETSD